MTLSFTIALYNIAHYKVGCAIADRRIRTRDRQ